MGIHPICSLYIYFYVYKFILYVYIVYRHIYAIRARGSEKQEGREEAA